MKTVGFTLLTVATAVTVLSIIAFYYVDNDSPYVSVNANNAQRQEVWVNKRPVSIPVVDVPFVESYSDENNASDVVEKSPVMHEEHLIAQNQKWVDLATQYEGNVRDEIVRNQLSSELKGSRSYRQGILQQFNQDRDGDNFE